MTLSSNGRSSRLDGASTLKYIREWSFALHLPQSMTYRRIFPAFCTNRCDHRSILGQDVLFGFFRRRCRSSSRRQIVVHVCCPQGRFSYQVGRLDHRSTRACGRAIAKTLAHHSRRAAERRRTRMPPFWSDGWVSNAPLCGRSGVHRQPRGSSKGKLTTVQGACSASTDGRSDIFTTIAG